MGLPTLEGTDIGRGQCHCPSKQGQALHGEAGWTQGCGPGNPPGMETWGMATKSHIESPISTFLSSPCPSSISVSTSRSPGLLPSPLFIFIPFFIILLNSHVSFKISSLKKAGNCYKLLTIGKWRGGALSGFFYIVFIKKIILINVLSIR